eukprot:m.11123 g.11123  ORF g.11123 m.11123 type:complete len:50 (+) comp5741_c0_seq1:429-578(+)
MCLLVCASVPPNALLLLRRLLSRPPRLSREDCVVSLAGAESGVCVFVCA